MAGYSKEFLLDAYVSRYASLGEEAVASLYCLGSDFYDNVGRDRFRVAASLDAAAIKEFKNSKILT